VFRDTVQHQTAAEFLTGKTCQPFQCTPVAIMGRTEKLANASISITYMSHSGYTKNPVVQNLPQSKVGAELPDASDALSGHPTAWLDEAQTRPICLLGFW
jgi:hypothetical protein